jgi:hypothetical protein
MDGPLIDAAAKGNRVTFAGLDTAEGRPAWRLHVVTATGLEDDYWLDTTTALQTKWAGRRMVNGKPVVFESFFRDWRSVDGVMFAFRIDSDTRGEQGGQHLRFDRVELGVPEPEGRFRRES